MTKDETTFLQRMLCDLIADGTMPADAAKELHLSWRTVGQWKRDPAFAQDFKDALDSCADALAARATRAHELVLGHKEAMVAQRGWTWACEKLCPQRYGQKLQLDDRTDGGQLLALLKEAVARITAVVPMRDVTPATRIIDTPQERHKP